MVFLFFMMLSLVVIESVFDGIAAIIRRMSYPRYRWNRGGRFSFN